MDSRTYCARPNSIERQLHLHHHPRIVAMCVSDAKDVQPKSSSWLDIPSVEQRQAWIDKLNERVVQITEVQKKNATDLAPEFVYSQQPMTLLTSGYPIYQLRSAYAVYFYTLFALSLLAYGVLQLPPALTVLCCVSMLIGYDLYSGILHVVFDHPSNIAIPVLGQPCLEFQWHHSIPDDIVRKSFLDVCGDLNVVILLVSLINIAILPLDNPISYVMGGSKLLLAYFGQYSHKSAHSVGKQLGSTAKWLQRSGVMISTKDHMMHHQPPYSIDFCLIGICNPVIDFLRTVTHSNAIWLTVFFIWSVTDLYLFTHGLTRLATFLHWM
jgi:palmitoyl-[glycerolipid] 3-(E)-desaturase